jgi:hypothetical protein
MTRSLTIAFALATATTAAVAGCGHSYSETGSTSTTAAQPNGPVDQRAIDAMTGARCEREARCDNVGANRHYVSREGCITQLRGEAMNSLTTSACPNGIDRAHLDRCLADVRGERCENVLDSLDRIANCSTNALCSR